MTGEIDTQGRVTGIGGMGVKLETAYAAGCKTLIIPRENLTGAEGIGRLPEALKHELQILTYAQWKTDHEPFDYTRHMLQVVAVDDIVQAADVAFIDQEEIESLDELFIAHARKAFAEMASSEPPSYRALKILYLDNPEEAKASLLRGDMCSEDCECVLLVSGDIREDILPDVGILGGKTTIRNFDPSRERLADVVNEIRKAYSKSSGPPLRISLVGPLPLLLKEGILPRDFPHDAGFLGLRLFASFCTVENVPIRECRLSVARTYERLLQLSDELLQTCPFLSSKDGIYTTTVSFIPEKYRIDARRAEEILDLGLSEWLKIVSGEEAETASLHAGPKS
jgi:ATP-dependent Lon protease